MHPCSLCSLETSDFLTNALSPTFAQNRLVYDLRAGPDLSFNEHTDKRRVKDVPQVRTVIDWSQVSVQGVRVQAQTPLLPAPNAASGSGSLEESAESSSSRSQTLAGTRRLLGDSRNSALTASIPLTMIPTEARTDAALEPCTVTCKTALQACSPALEPCTPAAMPVGAAQDDIQEGERLRARLLRQERDRGSLFVVDTERDRGDRLVVDTLTSAGGGDKLGAVLERKKLGDSPTTCMPAPPVSAPARPAAVERQGSGGGEGWEGGHILQGALHALGWPSSPQISRVSRLERVVEQELLAQYTL